MIRVRVKLFAACRDKANADEIVLTLPERATTGQIWNSLTEKHPALTPFREISRLAVNLAYVQGEVVLQDNDEVCIIPPVSGG